MPTPRQHFCLTDDHYRRVYVYFRRRGVDTPNERTYIVGAETFPNAPNLQPILADIGNISRGRRRDLNATITQTRLWLEAMTSVTWHYAPGFSRFHSPRTPVRVQLWPYHHKPRVTLYRAPKQKDEPGLSYYGVELEIDDPAGNLDRSTIPHTVHAALGEWWYCKTDGSLHHGVELVSHPATEAYWVSRRDAIAALLRDLSASGWKSHDARTCGMHVHIGRSAFTDSLHLYRFLHLVYRFPRHTLFISQRASRDALSRWASIDGRQRNALKYKVGLPGGSSYYSNGRYEAVNMTRDTAEVRIFAGTLRPDRYFKNLQFCIGGVEFTRTTVTLRNVTPLVFRGWLEAQDSRFGDLLEYLQGYTVNEKPMLTR